MVFIMISRRLPTNTSKFHYDFLPQSFYQPSMPSYQGVLHNDISVIWKHSNSCKYFTLLGIHGSQWLT